jgi:alkylation response protein AidB-like acyl-CoA dehydrogenase
MGAGRARWRGGAAGRWRDARVYWAGHSGEEMRAMQYRFTDDQAAFRTEVETFLKAELPPGLEGEEEGGIEWTRDFGKQFTDKLAKKGWLAPAWPKEYGGLGLNYWKQLIYKELMNYYRAPLGATETGIDLLGPTLMVYGTEEQKKEVLPQILRNEVWWAQGFSEPNSGSDLASLQTRAVEDGDEFVVNGGKIWTSLAQYASRAILLVRTDPEAPKHRGISFLLADLKAPGVRVMPLTDLAGRQPFNQVFFEDVRIPKSQLVGELNRGWYVAATTLDFERSGIEWPASNLRLLHDAVADLKARGMLKKPSVALAMADLAITIEVNRLMCYRVVSMQSQGLIPNHEASMSKITGSETAQKLARTLVNIYGSYGQLRRDSKGARLSGKPAERYMDTVAHSIFNGTNEIQRNIIATRGLGLPKV